MTKGADEMAQRASEATKGKLAAVLGEDFSWSQAMGGWRGAIESVVPGAVFVIVFISVGGLMAPLVAAGGVALVLAIVRLVQRTPLTQVLAGLVGVAIGFIWAKNSGKPEDYYMPALLLNAGYLLACLASLVAKWPLVGIVVGAIRLDLASWRSEPILVKRARMGTWLLVGMFALRLAVKVPLYLVHDVAWLGIAHIIMGFPLYTATLFAIWLLLRGHVVVPTPPARES